MTPGQAHAMKLDISDAKELGDENDEAMELIAMDDNSDDEAPAGKVTQLFPQDAALQQSAQLRMIEAVVFAAAEPLDEATIAERMPPGADIPALLLELEAVYSKRGVNLVRVAGKWAFRTASDVSFVLQKNTTEQKRLSRAGMETLAIVAYHQPVTRAEIEDIRGVTVSKGTIDLLLEVGWVRMRGRRRVPGRPVTYGTTDAFLAHFGLDKVSDLPGLDELKAAGLIEGRVPPAFAVPSPSEALAVDEDPLEAGDTGDHFHAEEEPVQVAEDIAPPQPETPESEG